MLQLSFAIGGAVVIASATAVPAALSPTTAPPPPVSANCTCLDSAADADLITALGWVCGPGGKVDCSPINTGGKYFFPNDAVDHANYAFTQFYHAHAADGYDTCFCKDSAIHNLLPVAVHVQTSSDWSLSCRCRWACSRWQRCRESSTSWALAVRAGGRAVLPIPYGKARDRAVGHHHLGSEHHIRHRLLQRQVSGSGWRLLVDDLQPVAGRCHCTNRCLLSTQQLS